MEPLMGGAYGMHGGEDKYRLIMKPHFKDLDVDGRIILNVS
jgi:hypothetical protein